MKYRLSFQVAREREPGQGRISDPATWQDEQSRAFVVDFPDGITAAQLDAAIERVAAARGLMRGLFWSGVL